MGADDYLVKPFGQRELVTRVRAHLRRAYAMDASRRVMHHPIRDKNLSARSSESD
jgi:DNA-binding response OmpR family regulator